MEISGHVEAAGAGVEVPYPYPDKSLPEYYREEPDGSIKELTRSEYKDVMRKEFTVRHRPIPMCSHKFAHGTEPRQRNCESCWFMFFQAHGELTKACDEVFQKFGEKGLTQLRGPKFTRNYTRFMSTIAQWRKMAEEANGKRISGAGEGGGGQQTASTEGLTEGLTEGTGAGASDQITE